MAPTKKTAAKKTPAKKVAPKAKTSTVTLASLEQRVAKLEQNDLVAKSQEGVMSVRDFVKAKYDENPPLTIGVGVAILILLVLIF